MTETQRTMSGIASWQTCYEELSKQKPIDSMKQVYESAKGMIWKGTQLIQSQMFGQKITKQELDEMYINYCQWEGVMNFLEKFADKLIAKGENAKLLDTSKGKFIWIKDEHSIEDVIEQYKKHMTDKIESMKDSLQSELSGEDW